MTLIAAVTFVEVLKYIGYIIVALLCLMFMIVIHEFGHFSVGRLLGFKVNEFSIGFGPSIFKHKMKKTGMLFAIRCVPLGGYCAFEGEDEEDENPNPQAFNNQKPWKRILVLLAGAFFNFVSAIIVISIFFMAFGDYAPKISDAKPLQGGVEQQFQADDVVLKVNGKSTYCLINQYDFQRLLSADEQPKTVTVLRNGEKIDIIVSPSTYIVTDENGVESQSTGYGISYGFTRYKYGFFASIGKAFVFSFKVVGQLFATIGGLFTGALGIKGTIGGPITAISSIVGLTKAGFDAIMYGVCVLSATLAIMNLLPIPALDGSKVIFTTIEWIRGKPINRKVENIIHLVGLILLFGMTILFDILNWV